MTGRVRYLVAAALLLGAAALADEEATTTGMPLEQMGDREYYPESWTKISFKPLVDNERLYKKYKECLLDEHPTGCPRDVLEFKKFIPDAIETLCAKCLPGHIEKIKEAAAYICLKRREDYDEVLKARDPDGTIRAKFEEKYGKISCE